MIRRTEWHPSFPLKFDRYEGFHKPPLTHNAQITVCPVEFFAPAKIPSVSILTVFTTPQRSPAAFLAGIKKLKFLHPSQRTETSHA